MSFTAAYMGLSHEELKEKILAARELLEGCRLCPRQCGARRTEGEEGDCGAAKEVKIASYGPHYGEERPLVGFKGSGTIFFSHCNLECIYCQNCDISWEGRGREISVEDLAGIMLKLQDKGCHNINLVTPTHYTPQILEALAIAKEDGLVLPLVYNCGGYESLEMLSILDGVIDIYMPDLKYFDPEVGEKYSGVKDYPFRAMEAVREMHRQVGVLKVDENGIATRGLLIRHLVLPENLAGTGGVMEFIAKEISPDTFVNIMRQYRPAHRARKHPPLSRSVTHHEWNQALDEAARAGISPRG
ncbi:MAG: radical SAM protein [Clostridia bacterium]|nr:radical SAM protein [Clostridia bacterium]